MGPIEEFVRQNTDTAVEQKKYRTKFSAKKQMDTVETDINVDE